MSTTQTQAIHGSKNREGDIFYPTGHVLLGFADASTADKACSALRQKLQDDADCVRISGESLAVDAAAEIEKPGLLAGFGSTLGVREQQLKLAQEGAEFVLFKADNEDEAEALLATIGNLPLRYGVRYGSLVIENLVDKAAHPAADAKPSRAS